MHFNHTMSGKGPFKQSVGSRNSDTTSYNDNKMLKPLQKEKSLLQKLYRESLMITPAKMNQQLNKRSESSDNQLLSDNRNSETQQIPSAGNIQKARFTNSRIRENSSKKRLK